MSAPQSQILTCDPGVLRREAANLETLHTELTAEVHEARGVVYVEPPGLDYVSRLWADYLNAKTDEWFTDANAYLAELAACAAMLRRNAADFEAQEAATAEALHATTD